MKATRWIVLATVVLGAVSLVLTRAEVGKKADADSEVRALRQRVEQLQARLRKLEDRFTKLESVKPRSVPAIEVVPNPPSVPPSIFIPSQPGVQNRSGQQPKIWGQGEIDGWPFYLIPCGGH